MTTAGDISLGHRASLAAATAMTGFLFWKQMKPPQPVNLKDSKEPTLHKSFGMTGFTALAIYRTCTLGVAALQSAAVLAGPPFSQLFASYAAPETQIDPKFLTWNKTSAIILPIVAIAASLRLRAMGELGPNFTFELHDPNKLITTGMYRYVQHPSYTTAYLAMVCGAWWFVRADGVAGGLLPPQLYELVKRFQWVWHTFVAVGLVFGLRRRVLEEEKMLRDKFGEQWKVWHGRTARFVPFLL